MKKKKNPSRLQKNIFQRDHYIKDVGETVERKAREADTLDYSPLLGIYHRTDLIFGGPRRCDVCRCCRRDAKQEGVQPQKRVVFFLLWLELTVAILGTNWTRLSER